MNPSSIKIALRLYLGFLVNLFVYVFLVGTSMIVAWNFYKLLRQTNAKPIAMATNSDVKITPKKVAALGRLEPQGKMLELAASPIGGTRIASLLVQEGDTVKKGQILAVLDGQITLLAQIEQAKNQVAVARSQLAQVEAGAKVGQIQAQRENIASLEANLNGQVITQTATINRLKTELQNAIDEYNRYDLLHSEGAISASEYDSKRLQKETLAWQVKEAEFNLSQIKNTLQKQIEQAKATLAQIKEVRPVDVAVARANVDTAITALKKSQSDLKFSYISSPIDGQIIKINIREGESINKNSSSIFKLARTQQMVAIAEVYETDIDQVRLGQRAILTSKAFPEILHGTVEQIGLEIGKQDVISSDPVASVDARVSEVKIRLDPMDSERVKSLTNLQLQIKIML